MLCTQRVALVDGTETTQEVNVVTLVAVLPVQTGIAVHGILGREHGTSLVFHRRLQLCHIVTGHTIDGHIVLLIGVDGRIGEHGARGQVTVNLVLGRDGNVHVAVVEIVLVLSRTILQNGSRIGQTIVGIAQRSNLVQIVLVDDVQVVLANLVQGEGIGTQHRRFRIGQEVQARNALCVVGSGSTQVVELAGLVRVGCIETYVELAGNDDVRVETDIQTVQVGLLDGAVVMGITHGQHVLGDLTTTLYVQAVVGGECLVIHMVGPTGIVVVLVVPVVVGIRLQETETVGLGTRGLQQF